MVKKLQTVRRFLKKIVLVTPRLVGLDARMYGNDERRYPSCPCKWASRAEFVPKMAGWIPACAGMTGVLSLLVRPWFAERSRSEPAVLPSKCSQSPAS